MQKHRRVSALHPEMLEPQNRPEKTGFGDVAGNYFALWGFGLRGRREPNPEFHYLRAGRDLFPGGCGLHGRGQADLQLDRHSFGAAEIAGLDQVAAALSPTRIVFGARDHPLSSIGR